MTREWSRRKYLVAAGVGCTIGVSGCIGNDQSSGESGSSAGEFNPVIESYDNEVKQGEATTVAYRVENTGDSTETQSIKLEVDGTVVDSKESVELDSGGTTSGQFTYETGEDDPPDVEVTVATGGATASRTVNVIPAPPVEDLDMTVDDVRNPALGLTSATVPVLFKVTNTNSEQEIQRPSIDYNALINDREVASDTVLVPTLEPGQSVTEELDLTIDYESVPSAIVSAVKNGEFSVTITGTVDSDGSSTTFSDTGQL